MSADSCHFASSESNSGNLPDCRRVQLANGIRLLWLDLQERPTVSIDVFVRAGSLYESARNNGVAHLLEHLHMTTSPRRPDRNALREAIAALPGYVNAETTEPYTRYTVTTAPARLVDAAELLADVVGVCPRDADTIEAEKRLIANELTTFTDGRDPIKQRLLRKHALGLSPGGSRRSVLKLTPEQVRSFEQSTYRPERIVVAIVGPVGDAVLKPVQAAFESVELGSGEPAPMPDGPDLKLPVIERIESLHSLKSVTIGFRTPSDPSALDIAAVCLLEAYFDEAGGALRHELRQGRSATYVFSADHANWSAVSFLFIRGLPRRRGRDAFLRSVLDAIASSRDPSIVGASLGRLRESLDFGWRWSWDHTSGLSEFFGRREVLTSRHPPVSVSAMSEALHTLTPERLGEYASSLFRRDNLVMYYDGLVRPFDDRRVRRMVKSAIG